MKAPLIFRIFKDSQLQGVKQFDQNQIVIGNNPEAELNLVADQVSTIHCMVELRDKGYYICDLGSQSGTFKNGQAILDEMISSGDELTIGPFRIGFYIGVPKPKAPPEAPIKDLNGLPALEIFEEKSEMAAPMPPPVVVKKQEIKIVPSDQFYKNKTDEKPSLTDSAERSDLKLRKSGERSRKNKKTFAPPSEIKELKSYLQLTKGNTTEVVVAWKERVLDTHHFSGQQLVRINATTGSQISLPHGIVSQGFPMIEIKNGVRVQTTAEMQVELVTASGGQGLNQLLQNGKTKRSGSGYITRIDPNELLCITLPVGDLSLYIRQVPTAPVVPLMPMMLAGSELGSLVMSLILVGLLAFYISATTPKSWEVTKQEEVQRIAQVILNRPPPPVSQVAPNPEPTPTPTPTPTPEPKKAKIAERDKDPQVDKMKKPPKPAESQKQAQANEVAPKPTARERLKKFTSTKSGGAVKMAEKAGANAKTEKKDLTKVGLFSAFGGGGTRANMDKAYSGAGEVLGMAGKATGTSGFNENRKGDDLGSKFKDSGAGGKGTATQGIAGIGTKGRSAGQSAYGASDGLGGKSAVAIQGGGMEEAFDGTVDKEAIRRVIRTKIHEIKSCYERALNRQEKGKRLEGKIVLGWEIVEKGEARNVKIKSSTLGNPQVESCIRDRLASWTFPEPPKGLIAEVQAYPFVLNQSN